MSQNQSYLATKIIVDFAVAPDASKLNISVLLMFRELFSSVLPSLNLF